jgi:Asp-tRNA(Asn)/Glu-tRNA(Gln) amidotransferase A subunit family amidase
MHLIGAPFEEEKLLSIASLFEKKYDNKWYHSISWIKDVNTIFASI